MYVPSAFKQERLKELHAAMRACGLATLVTTGPEGPIASHVPMLLDDALPPYGVLYGHIAKANPQWQRSALELDALALFLGPDAYISPSWYETRRQTGRVVPTWNYIAVHAYGRIAFFAEPERLLDVVRRLTERHEGGRAAPWAVEDAPDDFIRAQLKGIVGFRLAITRLEGKWKLGQNRSPADRAGTVQGLAQEDAAGTASIAALMAGDETAGG
jgi:transcriptional regulator